MSRRRHLLLVSAFLIAAFSRETVGQIKSPPADRQPAITLDYSLPSLISDSSLLPAWVKSPWLITLLAGSAGALVATENERPYAVSRWLDNSPFSVGLDLADIYGEGWVLAGGTLGVLAIGEITDSYRVKALGADLTRTLLLSGSVVWALKVGVGTRRPDGGPHSFPSGHTAAAFSVAPVLYRHLGPKAGIPAYILAGLTGLARMEDRRHFQADVAFGAAVGLAAGQLITALKPLGVDRGRLQVSPFGLRWHFDF